MLTATTSGRLVLTADTIKRLNEKIANESDLYLRQGDVLVQRSNTAELVGTTAVFDGPPGVYVYPDLMIRIRFRDNITGQWFWRYSNSALGRRYYTAVAAGSTGTMPKVSGEALRLMPIPLPPIEEQQAVTQALFDMDDLIQSLERLIAKKRDLKQAAMQQLLTGQTRLPGFSGEWELVSLDSLASRTTGVWGENKPNGSSTRLSEIIRAGDISQDGRLSSTATRYITSEEFERSKCTLDDLVITTSGNGLGKLWWCDGRANIAASNFVRVLHPKIGKATGKFLYYALRTAEGVRMLQDHTATSAYPNLRPTYFSAVWIPLPGLSEQIAIAEILSVMDAEITALEARLTKTRDVKQGMMQELLTGRTRLV